MILRTPTENENGGNSLPMPSARLVIPAPWNTGRNSTGGIQVTDTVRHTVEKLVPYSDTGRYPGGGLAWIPAFAGMTEPR